jgi:hypothetical protein
MPHVVRSPHAQQPRPISGNSNSVPGNTMRVGPDASIARGMIHPESSIPEIPDRQETDTQSLLPILDSEFCILNSAFSPMSLTQALEVRLQERAHAPALFWNDIVLTFADLDAASRCMAAGLIKRGVHAGDRVAVGLPNSPELVFSVLAVVRSGRRTRRTWSLTFRNVPGE